MISVKRWITAHTSAVFLPTVFTFWWVKLMSVTDLSAFFQLWASAKSPELKLSNKCSRRSKLSFISSLGQNQDSHFYRKWISVPNIRYQSLRFLIICISIFLEKSISVDQNKLLVKSRARKNHTTKMVDHLLTNVTGDVCVVCSI